MSYWTYWIFIGFWPISRSFRCVAFFSFCVDHSRTLDVDELSWSYRRVSCRTADWIPRKNIIRIFFVIFFDRWSSSDLPSQLSSWGREEDQYSAWWPLSFAIDARSSIMSNFSRELTRYERWIKKKDSGPCTYRFWQNLMDFHFLLSSSLFRQIKR